MMVEHQIAFLLLTILCKNVIRKQKIVPADARLLSIQSLADGATYTSVHCLLELSCIRPGCGNHTRLDSLWIMYGRM